jgi:hypothetical protein
MKFDTVKAGLKLTRSMRVPGAQTFVGGGGGGRQAAFISDFVCNMFCV